MLLSIVDELKADNEAGGNRRGMVRSSRYTSPDDPVTHK
jgi:hypothetical protein